MELETATSSEPQTPARQSQVPQPNRTSQQSIRVTQPDAEVTQTEQTAMLQQQLLAMQQQMEALRTLVAQSASRPPIDIHHPQSREYWALPIDRCLYPGEDSTTNAKTAYQRKLDSYLSKSVPIWSLVTEKSPCPIVTDADVM